MDYDWRTTDSMANGARRDVLVADGYRYRVIRWSDDGSDCETVAYYKTAAEARKRADHENAA